MTLFSFKANFTFRMMHLKCKIECKKSIDYANKLKEAKIIPMKKCKIFLLPKC